MLFTDLFDQHEIVIAPGAFDAMSARLVVSEGFPLAYLGGLCNEASDLGLPDLGFTTSTEIVRRAGNIAACVDVPVVCDADTGFGGPVNVARTVNLFENAGVSAIHLEDQTFPKRCGVLAGKEVVAAEEFEQTIRLALDARRSNDFQIIARSDAKGADGVAGVADRLKRYEDAGAHAVMVGDLYSLKEYSQLASAVSVPLIACAADKDHFDQQPDYSRDEWRDAGVRMVLYWHLTMFAAMASIKNALQSLKETGKTEQFAGQVAGYREYAELVDLEKWLKMADGD